MSNPTSRRLVVLWIAAAAALLASIARAEAPVSPDWLAGAQRQLEAREYHASSTAQGLQAPNRAHNLRVWFEAGGVRIHDRTAEGSPKLLDLTLAGVGRGDRHRPVAAGAVTSREGRVEIAREGLVEWYENSAAGLEQGFTLAKRPRGQGALTVDLAVQGATATLHGDAVLFATPTGRKLRYDHLVVADASGRALTARLAVPSAQRVRIEVEDAGAEYPLTIDPLLTETADAQLEADQASSQFGISMASAGDVNGDGYQDVIIGAPAYDSGETNEGAAFVFLGSATGIASAGAGSAAAKLEANQAGAGFGSVAGAGDLNGDGFDDVIVGARTYDATFTDGGSAFVFLAESNGSGIASGSPATADAHLQSDQANSDFGFAVAGAGDVNGDGYADAFVGADTYSNGETFEGAAFIFHGSASGIASGTAAAAATRLESNQASAFLGGALDAAGDMNGDGVDDVILGAGNYDQGSVVDTGGAFIFYGSSPSGIPNGNPATANVVLTSDQAAALFGMGVAGAGDVNGDGRADVIVGAPLYDAGETDEGAAFVFTGGSGATGTPASAWSRVECNVAGCQLGWPAAGAGDVNGDGYADIIVSAFIASNPELLEGRAFVYLGGSAGFTGNPSTSYAALESNQASAFFGRSLAAGDVNGDGYSDVIVGAALYDAGQSDEGAAFVYLGGNAGLVDGNLTTASLFTTTVNNEIRSAASAGDVNGDGYGDIIIGVPLFDAGSLAASGAAFVFHGSAEGIPSDTVTNAQGVIHGNQAGGQVGFRVAGAGDVDGDGYGDVIVGASSYDAPQLDEGAAFVFHGSSAGIGFRDVGSADAMIQTDQADAAVASVASAGDVNGDGYSDVIVAATAYTDGQFAEGAAFVFHGSAAGIIDGTPATADARIEANQVGARLGFACWDTALFCNGNLGNATGAGDVNGDGFDDVIVGATLYDVGTATDSGGAWVFHGSPLGIQDGSPANADARIENTSATDSGFGVVAAAGDIDADGYADVAIGVPGFGSPEAGAVALFRGGPSGIGNGTGAADSVLFSLDPVAMLGSVAGVGDVNGDGFADLLAGAPMFSGGELREGSVFVLLGRSGGLPPVGDVATLAAARIESNTEFGQLGLAVAGAGDVNGDGFADVLVGMPSILFPPAGPGDRPVMLYYGNANATGRPAMSRQLRGGVSTTPVQPWGLSLDLDDFKVQLTATDPQGRGRVKLEVQACPNGVPFGHASCTSSTSPAWTDVTATSVGVVLSHTLAGLTSATLYRWRARVLYAPFGVTEPGIASPPNPSHGPWRRLEAQAHEADIRTGFIDDDTDGVTNAIELAAPNGGDGNGDGTPDADQTTVASLPDSVSSNYVTVEMTSGCVYIDQASAMSEAQMPVQDPTYGYPRGIVAFTLKCGAGGAGVVTLLYHGSPSPIPPYRKYGPTTPGNPATAQWYDFPGATFGSRFVGGVQVATIALALTDGGLGDSGGVDGEIIDPGGPASVVVPALPTSGVVALVLLLGAAAAGALRARRSTRS